MVCQTVLNSFLQDHNHFNLLFTAIFIKIHTRKKIGSGISAKNKKIPAYEKGILCEGSVFPFIKSGEIYHLTGTQPN